MTVPEPSRRSTPLRSCDAPHHCPTTVRREVISRAEYFRVLGAEEIAGIDALTQVRGFEAGAHIYSAGESSGNLFVLAEGKVKLSRTTAAGREVVVDILAPGQLFGALPTLGRPQYQDSAVALTVSCALRISGEDFESVMLRHPTVAVAVVAALAHALEESRRTMKLLSGSSVERRVANALLRLCAKLGEGQGDSTLLQVPLTRGDLAAMTGTTTESVSRVMSRLQKDGIVETGRGWTSIRDPSALAALAD